MIRSLIRRLLCRHEFVERGTFRRGNWWNVLECEKCHVVKREKLLVMPVVYGRVDGAAERATEITFDQLRKHLRCLE